MNVRSAAVLIVITCSVSVACATSTTESEPTASGDAGSNDAGVADTSLPDEALDASTDSALATCNELAQQGVPVVVTTTQSPAPAAAGGTIADGTYVLTTAKIWGSTEPEGSSPGAAAAQTWSFRGATLDMVQTTAKAKTVSRSSGTIAPAGNTKLSLKQTCSYPASAAGSALTTPFTATSTTLSLYTPNGLATYELTYTKQ